MEFLLLQYGQTAILTAALSGHTDIVKMLMDYNQGTAMDIRDEVVL